MKFINIICSIFLSACIIHSVIAIEVFDYKKFIVLSPSYDLRTVKIDKFLEHQKHSYVVFVHDTHGNEYLVKQEHSAFIQSQFNAVFEKLTSHMAAITGISCQEVELLPIGFCFPGKFFSDRTATLHKKLPGKTMRELNNYFFGSSFSIKQNNKPTSSRIGFSAHVIKHMSKHPDLPPITAFDTFMGNRDRNGANILFDGEHFYAIDTALIHDTKYGKTSVGQLACNYIESLLNGQNKNIFEEQEYRSLVSYRDVLQKLVELFPPFKTYALLERFVEQSGLKRVYGADPEFLSIMNTYKERIRIAYAETEKLIGLLTKLLKNANKYFYVKKVAI